MSLLFAGPESYECAACEYHISVCMLSCPFDVHICNHRKVHVHVLDHFDCVRMQAQRGLWHHVSYITLKWTFALLIGIGRLPFVLLHLTVPKSRQVLCEVSNIGVREFLPLVLRKPDPLLERTKEGKSVCIFCLLISVN